MNNVQKSATAKKPNEPTPRLALFLIIVLALFIVSIRIREPNLAVVAGFIGIAGIGAGFNVGDWFRNK